MRAIRPFHNRSRCAARHFAIVVLSYGVGVANTPFAHSQELLPNLPVTASEGAPTPPQPNQLTLEECYQLALKRSETIAIQREMLEEAQGRFMQALSGILPRASFVLSERRQDGSGESAFTLRRVPEQRFTFSQPLFGGFKEFAAMAGTKAERRQRVHEKERAEQLLLTDVSDTFYLLFEQREDLYVLETIRTTLAQRIDELREREQLGRSRTSEVVSAEAQLRRIEAEIERVQIQETIARQLLEFLTGLDQVDGIQDVAATLIPSPLDQEDMYMRQAAARPDVLAAEEAWRVTQKLVTVSRARYWPTVNLEGNYYTERAGVSADIDWDALLKVDAPLFQGGQAVGAVREANSRARQAQLKFEQAQRRANLDARDAYSSLKGSLARYAALQKALDAAEQDYRLELEDYQRRLISNLDVLQALQTLQDARRDVIHARYETKRLYWALRTATGEGL